MKNTAKKRGAGRPVYLQLYERLRHEITEGLYRFGERFPSKRVLADRHGVSLVTAEHALSLLTEEGYLEPKERSGFYVSFREADLFLPEDIPARTDSGTGLSGRSKEGSGAAFPEGSGAAFSAGDSLSVSGSIPFPAYARAVRKVLSDRGETLLEKHRHSGVSALREALGMYLGRARGMTVRPEQIVIGSGSEYLYGLLVQLFGRGARFGIETPSYEKIELVYRANGCEPELLPLGPDGILSSALRGGRAEILHITPYRSFPTGISTSASKRREYLRWAGERGGFIIEDDYESEFTTSSKQEETVFSLSTEENVLYLNSFTRTVAPSIRAAYLVLPERLLPVFSEKLGFYACTVPALEQYVLAELLMSGEFERHVNRVRRRKRLLEKQKEG